MSTTSTSPSGATYAIIAAFLLAATALFGGLWVHVAGQHAVVDRHVETTATWTRFEAPTQIRCGRSCEWWVVPAAFSYQVGENAFTGRTRIMQSSFDRGGYEIGGRFRVYYDPLAPSDVVRRLERPTWEIGPLRAATILCAVLAALFGVAALRPRGRSLSTGE
jgi:hypothetical protein